MHASPSNAITGRKSQTTFVTAFALVAVLAAVVNWETMAWLVGMWWHSADYTHGFFVIPFACLLLWDRRDMLAEVDLEGSLWSIPFLAIGGGLAWYASYEYRLTGAALAMVPLLLGVVLLLGGWKALQWAWSAIVFLVFMVPLPGAVAGLLRLKLQLFGTQVSVFTLQTLGMPAVAEGNLIILPNSQPLEVADACSGIRMLMLFFAACIGAAFYLRREIMLIRVLIALSAIPIAIISNVVRITVTAFLHQAVSQALADRVFHDLAGWFMMPLAIVILWAETALFTRLFTAPEREAPLAFGVGAPAGANRAGAPSRPRGDNAP
ncbi:MAG: exosortase/archaeosortase family protein [Pirellulales bacterium]|nr:exosortase/archaeosortase family protein [Pirellulales bacterium]